MIAVVKKLIKQRQDGISQFQQGGRDDLVRKETAELALLKAYLPPEMPEEDLVSAIDSVIAGMGSVTVKDMGRVMKEVMAKTQGQADGKLVSELVRKRLGPA